MTVSDPMPPTDPLAQRRLSPNVATLGYVSMLTAMSSAMIYGLLPFMVRVLGISIASIGFIEGMAVARKLPGQSRVRNGERPDWTPQASCFVLGYTLSAVIKRVFPGCDYSFRRGGGPRH